MLLLRRSAIAAAALLGAAATTAEAPGSVPASAAFITALAAVDVHETVDYYDIGGSSVPALWQNIGERGPRLGATPWAGHARWNVRWTYDWRLADDLCRVDKASTSLTVTYTLPRWLGRDSAGDELKAKWDRFSKALLQHEQGHGANGRRAAERIGAALRSLPPVATCDALMRTADETARRIIDEEAANDRAYDAATQHGLMQGVVLR